jgi:hypothetical protein
MKRILLIFQILLFSLLACNKDDSAIHVIIEGVILNAETTQPVVDAKIEIITNNSTSTTMSDEVGYFNLGKYTIGDYMIIISKEGYATQAQQIQASDNISGGGQNGYDIVKSVVCNLVPATNEAELTVYRKFEDGAVLAAGNFPFVISTGAINAAIEGTTDENGRISLNNVPQVFAISIDHVFNGIRYKINTEIDIRNDNYIIVYGYNVEANLGLVSTNILDDDGSPVQDFPIDGTISLQFTMPVDTNQSEIDLLEDAWYAINYTSKWSNNNMQLNITPATQLKNNTLYGVSLDLKSSSGMQEYRNTINFLTNQ